jgi:hypothetical protein
MHAPLGREVQSNLLLVTGAGAQLAPPQPQHARGQDLGHLGQALGTAQLPGPGGAHRLDRGDGLRFRSAGESDQRCGTRRAGVAAGAPEGG